MIPDGMFDSLTIGPPGDPPPPIPFSPPERPPVVKVRFVKWPDDGRIFKCEVFNAATREVVGELYVGDVSLHYSGDGSHPEARVRLISAWEESYA